MRNVRIELDKAGIAELLVSIAVQTMLDQLAQRVADAARRRAVMVGGEPGDEALPINVIDASGATRARAIVVAAHPAALAAESKNRVLGGALDAAR